MIGSCGPDVEIFVQVRPLPFNNSRKPENRVSKSKIEFPALASIKGGLTCLIYVAQLVNSSTQYNIRWLDVPMHQPSTVQADETSQYLRRQVENVLRATMCLVQDQRGHTDTLGLHHQRNFVLIAHDIIGVVSNKVRMPKCLQHSQSPKRAKTHCPQNLN